MGMATRLYGCIEEYGILGTEKLSAVYKHNEEVISDLPENDSWPPLSKRMFAITHFNAIEPGPNLAYKGRIIHFGANFKSIEYEWKEWKDKFEDLLARLFWLSADVHFKTEYTDIQSFSWRIDLNKWDPDYNNQILRSIQREYWEYEGDASWENMNK